MPQGVNAKASRSGMQLQLDHGILGAGGGGALLQVGPNDVWLDSIILKVFSNLNDTMILFSKVLQPTQG